MSSRRSPAPALPTGFALIVLHSVGCVGSLVETGEATVVNVDAGGGSGACVEPGAASGSGHHKPGDACLQCHGAGIGPAFTLGGTVFDGTGAEVPAGGITLEFVDADGVSFSLTSAENGNFWTNRAIAFPVTTTTTSCPTKHPMVAPVAASGADCNSGGCHGTDFRIHAR